MKLVDHALAAPKPAWFGFSRFGSTVPSGRNCELRMVWSVGLLSWSWVWRPVTAAWLNRLYVSTRNCTWRAPLLKGKLRAMERSVRYTGHPTRTLRPDSRPTLLYVGPLTMDVSNCLY